MTTFSIVRPRVVLRILYTAVALILSLVVAPAGAGEIPPDLQETFDSDPRAAPALIEKRLAEHLGRPFPDLELVDSKGSSLRLSSMRGKRVVLFYAGGACRWTLSEIERLRGAGWQENGHFIVTILKNVKDRRMRKPLDGISHVYEFAEWPRTDFLAYLRVFPIYLYVDEAGTFSAFQIALHEMHKASKSDAPQKEEETK